MANERFILQPSQEPGFWVATDQEHGLMVTFKEHQFSQTHHPTHLNGEVFSSVDEALKYATYMSELDDWLKVNHKNIVL